VVSPELAGPVLQFLPRLYRAGTAGNREVFTKPSRESIQFTWTYLGFSCKFGVQREGFLCHTRQLGLSLSGSPLGNSPAYWARLRIVWVRKKF
jgi:hypothetical protein